MSELRNLNVRIRLENQQREAQRRAERQDAQDSLRQFTQLASSNTTTARELEEIASSSQDLGQIQEINQRMQDLKTGVDYVDNFIDANILSVENRKNTLEAKDRINADIKAKFAAIGTEPTKGMASTLKDLEGQYIAIANNLSQKNQQYTQDLLNDTKAKLEFTSLLEQLDTDKQKPGMQFRDKQTRDTYIGRVEPLVNVANTTEDFATAIAELQKVFPIADTRRREDIEAYKQMAKEAQTDMTEKMEANKIINKKKFKMGIKNLMGAVNSKGSGMLVNTSGSIRNRRGNFASLLPTYSDFNLSTSDKDVDVVNYQYTLNQYVDALAHISSGDAAEELRNISTTNANPIDIEPLVQKMFEENIKTKKENNKVTKETWDYQGIGSGMENEEIGFQIKSIYEKLMKAYKEGEIPYKEEDMEKAKSTSITAKRKKQK